MVTRIAFSLVLGIAGSLLSFGRNDVDHGVVHIRDLANTPWVIGHAPQMVILDRDPDGPAESEIRYELQSGKHEFCLTGSVPPFFHLIVKDETGNTILTMVGDARCSQATLSGGIYTLQISNSSDATADPTRFSALQIDFPSAPLVDANGDPLGGFWAIAPADNAYSSRLTAQQPPRDLGYIYSNSMPLVVDGSSSFDEFSLFSFPPNAKGTHHPVLLAPNFFLDLDHYSVITTPGVAGLIIAGSYSCGGQHEIDCDLFGNGLGASNLIHDLGMYTFGFQTSWLFVPTTFAVQPTSFSNQTLIATDPGPPTTPATPMAVLFRFYPDGTQIGTLNEGEAALFEESNYQGKAAVFSWRGLEADSYSSSATTLANSLVSLKLGNNTAVQVVLHEGTTGYSQAMTFYNDTPLISNPVAYASYVVKLDTILNVGGDPGFPCPQCRLVGANLSTFTLAGANWQQADMSNATLTGTNFTNGTNLSGAKFIGATLNNVTIQGSTISGTDFTGAKLTCVNFSGTDSQHLVDLTQAIMKNIQWIPSTSCVSNLAYTKLSIANVPPAAWKNMDLTGATFVDLTPGTQLSSEANPLDLSGAKLAGVSLKQVSLDYAVLTGAELTQTMFNSSSLQHTNLSGAKLYGAALNNVNLDGANLSGAFLTKAPAGGVAASLEGAFLRNVNLSQAQLSGADLTNASFYSTIAVGTGICEPNTQTGFTSNCATAAGAVLNNTQFGGAYLFGVDFSNSSIQGVQFANTFLTGANFNAATISVDASIGTNSGFSAAFLQGTNLATTKSLLSVSLQDAFVDFSSGGNTMYLSLNGYHTNFPGYWNTPGQPVCAEMTYSGPSVVPVDNSTITCPNGQSGPCNATLNPDGSGSPVWESPVDITQFASYQFDATFTKAPTPPSQQKCAYDPQWLTSGLGASQPPKDPNHKPHGDNTKRGNTHSEHQDVHVDRF